MLTQRLLVSIAAFASALLPTSAVAAQAVTGSQPITCGMVVDKSMNLHLSKDLYCPTFGVRVVYPNDDGGTTPDVSVDLRGHTLRGPGRGMGITAFGSGTQKVRVSNGVLKGWEIGLGGDTETRASQLALVGNRYGFFCNGSCTADLTVFSNNDIGINVGGEAHAGVKRSTFVGNGIGASVSWIWTLEVDKSAFLSNGTGVLAETSRPIVKNSAFVKNQTAIRVVVDPDDSDWACADLTHVSFISNKRKVVGPRCVD